MVMLYQRCGARLTQLYLAEQAKDLLSKCPKESKAATVEIVLDRLGTLQVHYRSRSQSEKYKAVNEDKLVSAVFF